MFGITFTGHPNPVNLYLPDGFEGHPLRKSYPLLAREVKPWPGAVEVAPLPGAGGEKQPGPAPTGGGGGS
jgi:NADH-quinone oxidoreductase subunit C